MNGTANTGAANYDSDKISWTVRALESIENNSIDRDEVESEAIDCEENPQFRVRFQVGGVWFTAQKELVQLDYHPGGREPCYETGSTTHTKGNHYRRG